jgi:hypothetical protein
MDEVSQQLEAAAVACLSSLRLGEPFWEDLFRNLTSTVRELHERWANSDMLPKSAVLVLIDLPRMIEACGTLYKGAEKQRVSEASFELVDVILEGF